MVRIDLYKNGHYTNKCADVAQLAEQLTCNQQVIGSIPIVGLKNYYGGIPKWPKGADCKSVGSAFEGSNPSPSTNIMTRSGAVR